MTHDERTKKLEALKAKQASIDVVKAEAAKKDTSLKGVAARVKALEDAAGA